MAKLSAHGRTEIVRLMRVIEPRHVSPHSSSLQRSFSVFRAYMSDGAILEKVSEGSWRVIGKYTTPAGVPPRERILADMLPTGWKEVKRHVV